MVLWDLAGPHGNSQRATTIFSIIVKLMLNLTFSDQAKTTNQAYS